MNGSVISMSLLKVYLASGATAGPPEAKPPYTGDGASCGTGFIIGKEGIFATCYTRLTRPILLALSSFIEPPDARQDL